MDSQTLMQRFGFLVTERSTAEERWDTIRAYIAPYRGEFFAVVDSENAVDLESGEIFDGTALQSAQVLASNLHGNLTSAYVQWFALSFRDSKLNDDPDAREWLEECGEAVWRALNESNFSHEIAENYLDLTTFASTFIFAEAGEEPGEIIFQALPLKQCYFEEGPSGGISHFYRWLRWTPLQLLEKFGEGSLPPDIADKAKGAQASATKEDVIFCIYPRKGKKRPAGRRLPPARRAWGAKYMLKRSNEMLGKEIGYYEMPVFVSHWAKVSESKWGHGPSHVAIYDVQALNRQEMLTLNALEKVIDPPQKATERGIIGDLDLRASGLTIVRSMDELKPMTFGTEWNVVDMQRDNRRAMIREYYMISRLDLKESPAMTATEVERRWQQMQKLLGPTLGRIQTGLLAPVIETVFMILMRAGRLPEPPGAVMQGAELDIEYTGPLPVAQKADVAAAIERELGLAANLAATYGPEVLDAVDATKALQEHARITAVPAKILRSDLEIRKLRKDREAAAAEAKQMEQLSQGAAAAKDLAGAAAAMPADTGSSGQEAGNVIQMPGMQQK